MLRHQLLPGTIACVALLALNGCGDDGAAPGASTGATDRDSTFTVEPGEQFEVVLDSNPTTGFAWELRDEPPTEVVRLVDETFVAPDTDLVGVAGRQTFTFEAVGDGTTLIQLWYVRSFDDPPDPADRAQFEVIVGAAAGAAPAPADLVDM